MIVVICIRLCIGLCDCRHLYRAMYRFCVIAVICIGLCIGLCDCRHLYRAMYRFV